MKKRLHAPGGISDVASQGGRARAEALSPEERTQIARRAVETRWERAGKLKKVPVATHGASDRPLRISGLEIPCYVLEDGRRVLAQNGVIDALGMVRGGSSHGQDRIAKFASQDRLKPFASPALAPGTLKPIDFRTKDGKRYVGYEATILADICEAVLAARQADALTDKQLHIAKQCEILARGFMRVGIIALVDEATGYQYDRARLALEEILEKFLSEELRRWVKTFPADYFKHLCRLRNIDFRADMKLPPYFGHLTNDIVYRRLAPGVLKELRERSPKNADGKRPNKLFQWLSDDVGHPKLLQHLGLVIGLMKVSDTFDGFKVLLDRAAPIYPENPTLFDDPEEWGIET